MCAYIKTADRENIAWNANQTLGADHFGVPCRWPLPNVWLGTSCERQQEADVRIQHLLATPAAVRFVSLEPLLGPIDLAGPIRRAVFSRGIEPHGNGTRALDWVIVGGESGRDARPMQPAWVRSLRDQCTAAGVPFFFKQWGEFAETHINREEFCNPKPEHLGEQVTESDSQVVAVMRRVGKKAAGRILDGREWNEMPGVRPRAPAPVAEPAEAP
jgi:protein gp37